MYKKQILIPDPNLAEERQIEFKEKFARIMIAVNAKNDSDLARILEITPQSISPAKTRGQIPSSWIEKISKDRGISADWLFFGRGPMKNTECLEIEDGENYKIKNEKNQIITKNKQTSSLEQTRELLESELKLERSERRELAIENRRLYQEKEGLYREKEGLYKEKEVLLKENSMLREKLARIEGSYTKDDSSSQDNDLSTLFKKQKLFSEQSLLPK